METIDRFNLIADVYLQTGRPENVIRAINEYPESSERTEQLYVLATACIDFRQNCIERMCLQ